jgi:hypothetical protein
MRLPIILLFACLAAAAQTPSTEKQDYDDLAKRVRAGDLSIDFQQLRFACAESKHCEFDRDLRSTMFQQLRQKSYDKVIENAEKMLTKNIANMDAHLGAWIAHKELGHSEKAQYHGDVLRRLFESLRKDGADGKTPATAIKVIDVAEEYAFMHLTGLHPAQQSLMAEGGHQYDKMVMKDKDDNEVTLYFNIDIPEDHLRRALGEADKPQKKK